MSINRIIFAQPITAVWQALGGDPPRRGRARAFYRKGDNPGAVSLNDEKGCWHDFVTGESGGVLGLVQRVLGGSRADALRWLSGFTGLPLDDRPLTAADRRQYLRARQEAAELVAWKGRLLETLQSARRRWWRVYHATRMHVLEHGVESLLGDAMATLYEISEQEIDRLDQQIDHLQAARFSELLQIFRTQQAAGMAA